MDLVPPRRRGRPDRPRSRSAPNARRVRLERLEERRLLNASQDIDVYLIDADTDQRIKAITNGETITVAPNVGDSLSIEAVPGNSGLAGQVNSMRLTIGGPIGSSQVENVAPYALFGDTSGNFTGRSFDSGTYSLDLFGFDASNAKGTLVARQSLSFQLDVGSGGGDPPPPPPPPSPPPTPGPVDPNPRVTGDLMT